jgi:hypothetical protein
VVEALKRINIMPEEEPILADVLRELKEKESEVKQQLQRNLEEEFERVQQSIKILLQKFLENSISKELFDDGHTSLLMQRRGCEERLSKLTIQENIYPQIQEFVTALRSLCERFCTGSPEQMRSILDEVFQAITTDGKVIHLHLMLFMEHVASREKTQEGWQRLFPVIVKALMEK